MQRWKIAAFMLLFAALPAMAVADDSTVGVFTDVSGNVKILRGDAYYRAVQGVNVSNQDIIETPTDGSAQLEMKDGSILRLGPDSRLALSQYRLDESGNVVSAVLDVISGWLRFQVAKLHQNATFHFDTPVMTIGIRGTEGTIDAQNNQGGLYLEKGEVQVQTEEHASVGPLNSQIIAGQYIGRARGHMFKLADSMPAGFHDRMPAAVRTRLVRRIQFLQHRGVRPRFIRRMNRSESERFLKAHPYMRQETRQQYRARLRRKSRSREEIRERERVRERRRRR